MAIHQKMEVIYIHIIHYPIIPLITDIFWNGHFLFSDLFKHVVRMCLSGSCPRQWTSIVMTFMFQVPCQTGCSRSTMLSATPPPARSWSCLPGFWAGQGPALIHGPALIRSPALIRGLALLVLPDTVSSPWPYSSSLTMAQWLLYYCRSLSDWELGWLDPCSSEVESTLIQDSAGGGEDAGPGEGG